MFDQVETACFDPNNMLEPPSLDNTATSIGLVQENGVSHENTPPLTPMLDQLHQHVPTNNPNNQDHTQEIDQSMQVLNNIQNPNLDNTFNNPLTTHDHGANNWAPTNFGEMGFSHYNDHENPTSTTDLLTLLHLPRCSFPSSSNLLPPTSSISFGKSLSPSPLGFLGELNPVGIPDNTSGSGSNAISYDPTTMPYDPLFHLNNLPPQPSPLLRDLMFQSLPLGYGGIQTRSNGNGNGNGNVSNSLFGGLEEGEGDIINGVAGIFHDGGDHHMNPNGIFEFTTNGNACLSEGKEGKCPKNFVTERQRRQNFNDKYNHLRRLVPSPSKPDRASIVKDAIEYIQELKRTVEELKLLVEKKRISKERAKRLKTDHQDTTPTATTADAADPVQGVDGSGPVKPDPDDGFNGLAATQLRSSWLQRKFKDTEVDVRIVDDDVTIKLVQRKKINCLLPVSTSLDELQLELRHVAGGHVGDYYSYLFNTKICEGSSVYASAIANKVIEVVDRQYAAASIAIPPTCSF
ncbi:hypothetical protein Cgig2_026475 [Carnegiea gigantea]|uniref:BHLH domain-containing protein n=1 Tax=Carnegiea gigantea TaxID=171969 RepID=A0A9Q1KGQ4_9CARY|nr:hypothetical protein Cgig2_026475 [Carnegiea gigantea]